jgi:hypothetical protein
MARVDWLREVRHGSAGDWQLCFQWCRYRYDTKEVQYGYRFVWRRAEDGSIQAARGQARLPSIEVAQSLIQRAQDEGWGDRDFEKIEETVRKLEACGCVVDLATAYVGWPNKEAAINGHLTPEIIEWERLIREWCH